jgi:hypothetical protein
MYTAFSGDVFFMQPNVFRCVYPVRSLFSAFTPGPYRTSRAPEMAPVDLAPRLHRGARSTLLTMLGFCLTVCVAASSNQEAGQSQEAEVKELDPCWSSPNSMPPSCNPSKGLCGVCRPDIPFRNRFFSGRTHVTNLEYLLIASVGY